MESYIKSKVLEDKATYNKIRKIIEDTGVKTTEERLDTVAYCVIFVALQPDALDSYLILEKLYEQVSDVTFLPSVTVKDRVIKFRKDLEDSVNYKKFIYNLIPIPRRSIWPNEMMLVGLTYYVLSKIAEEKSDEGLRSTT